MDGTYFQVDTTYRGTATGDPRLSGRLVVQAKALVRVNPDAGPFQSDTGNAGLTTGSFRISPDPDGGGTGRAFGRFVGTVGSTVPADATNNLEIEGVAFGRTRSVGDLPGGDLVGNFNVASDDPTGNQINGTLGGDTGDSLEQPAFIQNGECQTDDDDDDDDEDDD